MPTTYAVHVLRRNINRLYLPRGDGYRWHDRVVLQMHRASVAAAPTRSGGLAASHRITGKMSNGAYVRAEITNIAEHAEWVHEGTPPIYAKKLRGRDEDGARTGGLWLPPGGPGKNTVSPYAGQRFGKKWLDSVAGQKPNRWLENACTRVAVQHGGVVIG